MISINELTNRVRALDANSLHFQIVNFSGIDEKGMNLEYYDNIYVNVEDLDSLENNVLYITGLPASGKSELAEKLSKKYGIPVIGLDELANNDFDFSNEVIVNYIKASQSDSFEQISENEAENFLNWLKSTKNSTRVIVEGYQIYKMNYKSEGKFYNSMIKNKKISMIIVNPNPETIIENRITRDKVDRILATKTTIEELAKLKEAFPMFLGSIKNL